MEERRMRITNSYISSLLLAAAILAPAAVIASPIPNDDGVQVRVYDTHHKDYHNWDGQENHAWGLYLTNNHRKAHEYKEANKREQQHYWNWRHSQPDHD
jgi:hypothetical protein